MRIPSYNLRTVTVHRGNGAFPFTLKTAATGNASACSVVVAVARYAHLIAVQLEERHVV
jgi:hypothetical protein